MKQALSSAPAQDARRRRRDGRKNRPQGAGTTTERTLAAHPGLSHTRLTRLEDGAFTGAWRWDTAGQMHAAVAAMPIPRAPAALSLTRDTTAQDGEIADER